MNFDELLRKSLESVNEKYEIAYGDVYGYVEKLRAAVNTSLGANASVELVEMTSDVKSTIFRLVIDTDSEDANSEVAILSTFKIKASGYPIEVGFYNKSTNMFRIEGQMDSKEDLEKFFIELLATPESSLIQIIGFALRKRNQ